MSEGFQFTSVAGSGGVLDVVFVHGLSGDPVATWTCAASGEVCGGYWPSWIASDIPGTNVFSMGYPANVFARWAKLEMSLYERAKAALEHMASLGLGTRPICFIGHSLGGLLIKQIVRTGSEAQDCSWVGIVKHARLVAFLATPHTGACLASL